jgi:neutral ceramidase
MHRLILFLALAPILSVSLGAADAGWQIGLASVKITPEHPVLMYGYGGRNLPHQGVTSELHAKALALQDATGARAVLVTCDLGGLHGDMVDRIAARLKQKHGLPRASVLYNASHTHAGPWAWVAPEEIVGLDPVAVKTTAAYIVQLERILEQVAEAALGRLEPATLSWGLGMAPFVMNRREFTDRGIILGFNPKGPVDRSVLVLRVDDPRGQLRAVLMGVACHCTCSGPKNYQIDGDYAGHAQADLQARFPGAQAMFLTGCGGDANPWPRGELIHARQHGATLAAEVARVLAEKLAPVRPPLRTAYQTVALPIAPPAPREQLAAMAKGSGWQRYLGTRHLALLDQGLRPAPTYAMPIALWNFGADLTLVGLSGEPVNDYVHLIARALGPMRLWVAGYCHDVFGYVPSARILAEGGYETRGLDRGDAVGQFTPEAQELIVTALTSLARETGRLRN